MSSTLVYPEGTLTLGATSVVAVPTVVDPAAASLATEVNGAGSLNLAGYLYPEGWNPSADTPTGSRKARLASKTTSQVFNRTNFAIAALQYIHDPQGADADTGNEARDMLQQSVKVHLLERQGPDAETEAWAVGDRYLDHYVELGPQVETGDRADENAEFYVLQSVIYVNGQGPTVGVVVA